MLLGLIRKGKAAARRLTRAHILLLADEGRTDEEIATALHTNPSTAEGRTALDFAQQMRWLVDEA